MGGFCVLGGCDPTLCTRITPRKASNINVFLSNLHFIGAVIKVMAVKYSPTPQNISCCFLNSDMRWSKMPIYGCGPNKHSSWSMLTPKTCTQPLTAVLAIAGQKTHRIYSTLCFKAGPRRSEKKPEGQNQ